MLQLGFVVGDLVCERSDVCGKSAGWRSVAFHSGGLYVFFFFFFDVGVCGYLSHMPCNKSIFQMAPRKKNKPGSMKSDIMWHRHRIC